MQTVITGCGRSGTNLLLEMVRASGKYRFTQTVEDRGFFKRDVLPDSYGSKIAIEWDAMTIASMTGVMEANKPLKVLWSFRHPYDVILSKVYRGRPKSMGGDNDTEQTAKDGTVEAAAKYVQKSWQVYEALATAYPKRVKPVRMEDILANTASTVRYVARFLMVPITDGMKHPWKHNRNAYQNNRYHHAMDRREINKWKYSDKSYDGYFSENIYGTILSNQNNLLREQAEHFGYELI